MPRIRTIKPEFPQSESIGRLSRDARLLFVQLWTLADDSGRARAASRMLASLLYPYDDDAPGLIGDWLDELQAEGMIQLYEVDGATYLQIVKWLDHQKIDRPSPSKFPGFDEASRKIASPREDSLRTKDQGPRTKEGIGTMEARASRLPEDWTPEPETEIPDDVAARERPRFADYWRAQPGAKGRKLDWQATWRNWCRRSMETRPNANPTRPNRFDASSPEAVRQRRAEIAKGLGLGLPGGGGADHGGPVEDAA